MSKFVGIEDYPTFVDRMVYTAPRPSLAVVAEGDKKRAEGFNMIHAVLGLTGEAGEVSDHIKKHFFNTHKILDVNAVILELGDVLFYVQLLLNQIAPEMTIEDVIQLNIDKLVTRYPDRARSASVVEETR